MVCSIQKRSNSSNNYEISIKRETSLCFLRWEIVPKECQKAQHVIMSKCCVAFHYESSTQRQTDRERTESPALCPSSLWPSARPAPTEDEREREGVVSACGCVCVRGANIPLAGSPGPGGGQGSAGEGEAACPAVN